MKIFLIGFMGSGKSTMGRKLAGHLGYTFTDLDHLLEKEAGMSINDFFQLHGEEAFREFERRILHGSEADTNSVIATGGGAPCFFDNMEWMNKNGITIYLKMAPKALADRLRHATDRPLIKGLSEEGLLQYITDKLNEREPFYEKALHTVSGIDLTADKLARVVSGS